MGERIVSEAGLADSVDTLGRWMCHRVAEHMSRADDEALDELARQAARKDATDLILRLWKQRCTWPKGWPPKGSKALLQSLEPSETGRRREATGSPWLDRLDRLEALAARERRLWIDAGILDLPAEEDAAALEHGEMLSDEERDAIERFRSLRTLAHESLAQLAGADDGFKPERVVARALAELRDERVLLLETALSELDETDQTAEIEHDETSQQP